MKNVLQKQFYQDLHNWYTEIVKDPELNTAENLGQKCVYLITYLVFCWLLKEHSLLHPQYFLPQNLQHLLKNRCLTDNSSSIYLKDKHIFQTLCNFIKDLSLPDPYFFDSNKGLFPLLEKYQFTLKEHQSEQVLDPEILGSIFENLLATFKTQSTKTNVRKETGSFYTPSQVVNFMVDKSLKAYFINKVTPHDTKESFEKRLNCCLFSDSTITIDDLDPTELDQIIREISLIKILDPALGSGAFAIGVLNKLTLLLKKIDPENHQWLQNQLALIQVEDKVQEQLAIQRTQQIFSEYPSDYTRKFFLISNNIYGIDIQPLAIILAKLRLFFSLISEQSTKLIKDRPISFQYQLPEININFVCANTLIPLKKKALTQ